MCPGEENADGKCVDAPSEGAAKERDEDTESDASGSREASDDPKGPAQAQPSPPADDGKRATPADDRKRAMPDYDGVPDRQSAQRAFLWIPRVSLFPLYVVSEYVVRRPLGFLVRGAIKQGWIESLIDIFTFGPNRQAGIVPTALFDFRFRPSVGVYAFWDDAAAEGHDLRLRAATGGSDWWQFALANRFQMSPVARTELRGAVNVRPDRVFYGMGPLASGRVFRYYREVFEAEGAANVQLWRSSELATVVGFRGVNFDPDKQCCNDPSLSTGMQEGRVDRPPGLEGYDIVHSGVRLRLDSRHRRHPLTPDYTEDFLAPPGSGTKLAFTGIVNHSIRLADPRAGEVSPFWINYGVTWGGYVALPGYQRTLGLELSAEFADPVVEGDIPFTEQAALGGSRVLRGFLDGRLIDRSAVAGRLRYSWPVWPVLDGVLEYGVGSVFGERLSGFDPALLRQSFGFGLEANARRDHAFQFLFAIGTETFSEGSRVDTIRFVVGGTSGI